MNSLLKNCVMATILSLSLATTASANPLKSNTLKFQPVKSENLIAQFVPASSPFYTKRLLSQMLMQNMQMAEMAQEAMKSPDPEIRKMAQEMMTSSNTNIRKLINLMRLEFLSNPDK